MFIIIDDEFRSDEIDQSDPFEALRRRTPIVSHIYCTSDLLSTPIDDTRLPAVGPYPSIQKR